MKWWEQIGDGQRQSPTKRRSVYEDRNLAPKPEPPDEHWVPLEQFIARRNSSWPPEPRWPPEYEPWRPDDL